MRPDFSKPDERLKEFLAQMHGRGTESDELGQLLNEQGSQIARVLSQQACDLDPQTCKEVQDLRDYLKGTGGKIVIGHKQKTTSSSRWLAGLKKPKDFPITDDERVRFIFERYTVNTKNREEFQNMYFRCGAYRGYIESLLTKYELPTGILALVFVESGCVPTITSPAGATGLWQLMPAAGRAYHLRVNEEIDERRNPVKSTQAGIRYLADVYNKLKNWEFTFASYNMGMFGLLSRIQRAGGDPNITFWDLADNELLPKETANYVPWIEAYALILENIRQLNFDPAEKRPQVTGDVEVPPGTRLGLIAHAASTSVNQIRSMNPDILVDHIPTNLTGKFFVQVPQEVVFAARDKIQQLITSRDESDLCVPETFDWGQNRFTVAMAAKCRARGVQAQETEPGK